MKTITFTKKIKTLIVIIALAFSTNTQASTLLTWGSWWGNWWGGWSWSWHTHYRGCGHYGTGGGSQGGGDSVPIDGGLGILLIGATAFGIKKLRNKKNENI